MERDPIEQLRFELAKKLEDADFKIFRAMQLLQDAKRLCVGRMGGMNAQHLTERVRKCEVRIEILEVKREQILKELKELKANEVSTQK